MRMINNIKWFFLFFLFCSCYQSRYDNLNKSLSDYIEAENENYKVQLRKMSSSGDTTLVIYNLRLRNISPKNINYKYYDTFLDTMLYLKGKQFPVYPIYSERIANGISDIQEYMCVFNAADMYGMIDPVMIYHDKNFDNNKKLEIKLIR